MRKQTEKDIQHLAGLDKIRAKVSMYLGSSDGNAMWTAVRELLDNAIDEASSGRNDYVHLVRDPDNKLGFYVIDNGGGMPVKDIVVTEEISNKKTKISALKALVYLIHTGGKFAQSESEGGLRGTHGVGQKATNAVSLHFKVWTYRDGKWYHTSYEKGKEVIPVKPVAAPKFSFGKVNKGTIIYCQLDTSVFDRGSKLNEDEILSWFDITSKFSEGIVLKYTNVKGETKTWESGEYGVFLDDMVSERKATYLTEDGKILLQDKFWDLALAFTDADGAFLEGYSSGLYNADGGTHVQTVYKVISDVVSDYAKKNQKFSPADLRDGVVGCINIKLTALKFHNQEKTKLVDERCQAPLYEELYPHVEQFFEKNKELAQLMCERASKLNVLKADFKANKQVLKAIKQAIRKNPLPVKLKSALNCPAEERELFLVEGDSAGGSAKAARDASYQEVLPLKGKIKNAFKDNASSSEEIMAILLALGFNPDAENPMEKARVGRVIVMTDPDVDGYHIQTLIYGVLLNYAPQFVEEGRVYVVMPYEYMASYKGGWMFAETKEELQSMLPASAQNNIMHVKGWGEVDSSVLSEMAFNREVRSLKKLTSDNMRATIKQAATLMESEGSIERKRLLGLR